MIRKHVSEPWFSYISSGQKKIEGRLNREPWSKLQPGDKIEWYNCNRTHLSTVVRVIKYRSFKEMIESEGLEAILPDVFSTEEGVRIYRQYFTEEDERDGVLAIHLS